MPQFTFNPFTGKFDAIRNVLDTTSRIYLGDTTYLNFDGINTVSLIINSTTVQSWTVATSHAAGEPMGLLLGLTYATAG